MTAQELKNSILQLAVQGKLVPQCKDDEPASELTRQIIERRNQIEKNHIKTLSSISEDEISFEIPESWILLRLGDFCQVYNGNSINATVKQEKYSRQCGGYSFIATKDLGFDHIIDYDNGIYIPKEETGFKIAIAGSILLCMEGGSAGKKIGILTRDVCFGNKLCCFTPYVIDSQYLYYYLQSPMFFSDFFGSMTGLIGGVGSAKLKNLFCPIPPLAEQKRIVEKIEELMPLVEAYGKAEEQLSKLNAEFPDKLRKSILQQAVQGKLTERDPADEPALELLKRIRDTKKKLVTKGEVYREKELTSILDDDMPFDLPDSWCWCKLGEITKLITKGSSPSWQGVSYTTQEKGILFVTSENVGVNEMLLEKRKYIEAKFNEMHPASILQKGDLLTNIVGASIGRTALFQEEIDNANINQAVCIIRLIDTTLTQYLLMYLNSSTAIGFMVNKSVESARANLSLTAVTNLMVPLPPLAEQKRIVKRVEELLALCDEMKGV